MERGDPVARAAIGRGSRGRSKIGSVSPADVPKRVSFTPGGLPARGDQGAEREVGAGGADEAEQVTPLAVVRGRLLLPPQLRCGAPNVRSGEVSERLAGEEKTLRKLVPGC